MFPNKRPDPADSGIDVPRTLNAILSTCYDCESFYSEAGGRISNEVLSKYFAYMGPVWLETIAVLRPYVEVRGAAPANSGTIGGAVRRAFETVRAKFASGDEGEEVLRAYLAAETRALDDLHAAAEEPLPDPVRSVVAARVQVHESAHAKLKALVDEVL